jgi:hypothetical protein
VVANLWAEPVFVEVYGHLGIDSENQFQMKNWFWRGHGTWAPRFHTYFLIDSRNRFFTPFFYTTTNTSSGVSPNPDHNDFSCEFFLISFLQWQITKARYIYIAWVAMYRTVQYNVHQLSRKTHLKLEWAVRCNVDFVVQTQLSAEVVSKQAIW